MLGVFTNLKNAYVKVSQVSKACEQSFISPDYVEKCIPKVARLMSLLYSAFDRCPPFYSIEIRALTSLKLFIFSILLLARYK